MSSGSHDKVVATYRVQSPLNIEQVAKILAGEQSTGSYKPVPGEEKAEFARAHVLDIAPDTEAVTPSLPSAHLDRKGRFESYSTAIIKVAFPDENAGSNLPVWLATLAGNLFELGELTAVRLLNIDAPPGFAKRFPGPQFGISGTRSVSGVKSGPLVGTIIKPCVGFSPEDYASRVAELVEGDIDFIKDDELMGNPSHCPLHQRIEAVMSVIRAHFDKTGKRVMYAFNISDSADLLIKHHDKVVAENGTAVMVNLNGVGLSGLEALRKQSAVPIHGHRAGWGMYSRHQSLGMDFQPYQLLHRLAGADQIHIGGFGGKFCETDEEIGAAGRACLTAIDTTDAGKAIMPVISAGQWGGQAPTCYDQLKSDDVLYLAGSGIQSHPDGVAAGISAIRTAWDAAQKGVSLIEAAQQSPSLKRSIEFFGEK